MCGIAGLFLKNSVLQLQLGSLVSGMIGVLSDRGPDSAGFAIYGEQSEGLVKVTLRVADVARVEAFATALQTEIGPLQVIFRDSHCVVSLPVEKLDALKTALAAQVDEVEIVSIGDRMEIYKEVGLPKQVTARFNLQGMAGTHAIGHTRMATESAVTTRGAHPFSTGSDQCLVHNGSLSNHNAVRRELVREGMRFATDNDSEVAAGYLTWRMKTGNSLENALSQSLRDLDGFYTFVVGTESGFAVLRDPIACKPAVMAETD